MLMLSRGGCLPCILFIVLVLVLAIPPASATRPGDYTDYYFNQDGPFYNLDIYLTWEVAPSNGSIYPAFSFGFQAGSGGYMGIQLVGDSKRMIFAIWDISEGAETALPRSANCHRFSGEGTGATCGGDYNWVIGREYRLRLWAAGADSYGESWLATILDTKTGQETQIGLIYLENSADFRGYGWLNNKASIFLEYFNGEDTCLNQPFSKVTWRGPFANNGDYLASRAVLSYPSCSTNNVLSSEKGKVTHEAGDAIQAVALPGTSLWDAPTAGILKVQGINTDDSPILVSLFVDGIFYSAKTVPAGATISFDDFTMGRGEHETLLCWVDPDTQRNNSASESVFVTPSGTTEETALRVPEFQLSERVMLAGTVLLAILLTMRNRLTRSGAIKKRWT